MNNIAKGGFAMIVSLLMGYSVLCQSESRQNKHRFGLHAGFINGGGFSYRFTHNKIGVQVSGFVFNTRKQELIKSMGGSLTFVLEEKKDHDLFAFMGGFIGNAERRSESDMNLPLEKRYKEVFSLGAGIGYERRLGDSFRFTLQVGPNFLDYKQKKRIFFSLGTGFYYCI